jgi:hypothetical protein
MLRRCLGPSGGNPRLVRPSLGRTSLVCLRDILFQRLTLALVIETLACGQKSLSGGSLPVLPGFHSAS